MLRHVQEVQINILSDVFGHVSPEMQRITQRRFVIDPMELEHSRFEAQAPATILPKRAHFISVIVDKQSNTYMLSDKLYTSKMHYSLRNIIPSDSVIHALVFEVHNSQRPVLGLFDASVIGGKCLSQLPCLERHAILHKAFRNVSKCAHIRMHWVGHERVLVHDLQNKRVAADFDIDCAVRLADAIDTDIKIARLIPKEPMTTFVPKLDDTKMQEVRRQKRAKLCSN
jgi:hypothetical protein